MAAFCVGSKPEVMKSRRGIIRSYAQKVKEKKPSRS